MKRTPVFNERFVIYVDGKYMQHDGVLSSDIRQARKFVVLDTAVKAAQTLLSKMQADCRVIAIKVASRTLTTAGI